MSQAAEAAQRMIYARLNGAISCPVYDEPPETPTFPYVTIGDALTTARNTMGRTGRSLLCEIDAWSRSGADAAQDGYGEALGIAGEIDALLDDYEPPAPVDGWTFNLVAFEQQQTLRDPDGITRRVMLNYRVLVER